MEFSFQGCYMIFLKNVIAVVFACVITFCSIPAPSAGNEPAPETSPSGTGIFSDVNDGHWAYEPIKRMTERNILNGYPDGSFKPQQPVSRSEFSAMLVPAAGLDVNGVPGSNFADVSEEAWYRNAVSAVAGYLPGSIEQGGKRYFLPRDQATREDVVVALVKALGAGTQYADAGVLKDRFADFDAIDAAARMPLAWAYQNNLLSGFPDGTLKPGAGISRAEVAALLNRAFFTDTSIDGLVTGGIIKPLMDSEPEYSGLITLLHNKYGQINPGSMPGYAIEYNVRKIDLYNGQGPQVLYVFGNIEPRYHNWEVDFERSAAAVREFTGTVAGEAARLYPRDTVLVVLGHQIKFLFDVSKVYDDKYLTRTDDGWRLERFYSGVMVSSGIIVDSWTENQK